MTVSTLTLSIASSFHFEGKHSPAHKIPINTANKTASLHEVKENYTPRCKLAFGASFPILIKYFQDHTGILPQNQVQRSQTIQTLSRPVAEYGSAG